MEIPDGCWDIFHIIEHLEEAEMLRDVQCHPGDYYTTLKGTKWEQSCRKAGTMRPLRKVWAVGSHCRLRAVMPCLLSGTARSQLMLFINLRGRDLPLFIEGFGNTKAISWRGQGAFEDTS